ncbi:MAG: ATPase [Paenibacillus sp.]|nr:ATPase [Paenibacillus sp.]
MPAANKTITRVDNNVLFLERDLNAPRELVFKMFKEPEHLKHWWGPIGWELPVCNIDFRPGGVWHYCMKCVEQGEYFGMESWGKGIYKEIMEPKTIMYTDYFSDAEGNLNDTMPSTEITIELVDLGGKTKMVQRAEYVSAEALKTVLDMGMLEGTAQTFDRLEKHLEELQ